MEAVVTSQFVFLFEVLEELSDKIREYLQEVYSYLFYLTSQASIIFKIIKLYNPSLYSIHICLTYVIQHLIHIKYYVQYNKYTYTNECTCYACYSWIQLLSTRRVRVIIMVSALEVSSYRLDIYV